MSSKLLEEIERQKALDATSPPICPIHKEPLMVIQMPPNEDDDRDDGELDCPGCLYDAKTGR